MKRLRCRPAAIIALALAGVGAAPWTPDQGDGTYRNPVIFADYSDPDVIRDGDDYYLVASSFNCTPGLPILHSRDLVNWTMVNHAVENLPRAASTSRGTARGCGRRPSATRRLFLDLLPDADEGIYVTRAATPRDVAEPPCWSAGAGSSTRARYGTTTARRTSSTRTRRAAAGSSTVLRRAPPWPGRVAAARRGNDRLRRPARHPTFEGPKFHKRDGPTTSPPPPAAWRRAGRPSCARDVYGPYEARSSWSRVRRRQRPAPGRVDRHAAGEDWFVHFQDPGAYGRIVHLQPVRGGRLAPDGRDRDGNGIGEPVGGLAKPHVGAPRRPRDAADERRVRRRRLGLQWQWHANPATTGGRLDARRMDGCDCTPRSRCRTAKPSNLVVRPEPAAAEAPPRLPSTPRRRIYAFSDLRDWGAGGGGADRDGLRVSRRAAHGGRPGRAAIRGPARRHRLSGRRGPCAGRARSTDAPSCLRGAGGGVPLRREPRRPIVRVGRRALRRAAGPVGRGQGRPLRLGGRKGRRARACGLRVVPRPAAGARADRAGRRLDGHRAAGGGADSRPMWTRGPRLNLARGGRSSKSS